MQTLLAAPRNSKRSVTIDDIGAVIRKYPDVVKMLLILNKNELSKNGVIKLIVICIQFRLQYRFTSIGLQGDTCTGYRS